jgi:hypothetical protein
MGLKDVNDQGKFISKILEAVDGVLLLDLHNLFCQIHNWKLDPVEIMKTYPLERVREIHISGGSWSFPTSDDQKRPFRRDTHDDNVPKEVLDLLPLALKLCPNLEIVIFERLGETVLNNHHCEDLRKDFRSIKEIVDKFNATRSANEENKSETAMLEETQASELKDNNEEPFEDPDLEKYQSMFLSVLGKKIPPAEMLAQLKASEALKPFRDYLDTFELRCVETGAALVRRWVRY